MMDEKYIQTYTRWIRANATKEVLGRAQTAGRAEVRNIADDTLQGAAKAHWYRAGMEWVFDVLLNQMTVEQLETIQRQGQEPDFGAEEIMARTLMKE